MALRTRSLGLIGIGLLLGTAGFNADNSADAASITADVTVEIFDGDLLSGETFFGTLVYDDSFLTGSGFEILSFGSGLESFEFTYVGTDLTTPVTYTASDDVNFPNFPELGFTDGGLSGLIDGLLYEVEVSPDLSFFFDGQLFGTDQISTGSFNNGTVTYTVASVPEPASILATVAVGLFGVASCKRRQQA